MIFYLHYRLDSDVRPPYSKKFGTKAVRDNVDYGWMKEKEKDFDNISQDLFEDLKQQIEEYLAIAPTLIDDQYL